MGTFTCMFRQKMVAMFQISLVPPSFCKYQCPNSPNTKAPYNCAKKNVGSHNELEARRCNESKQGEYNLWSNHEASKFHLPRLGTTRTKNRCTHMIMHLLLKEMSRAHEDADTKWNECCYCWWWLFACLLACLLAWLVGWFNDWLIDW